VSWWRREPPAVAEPWSVVLEARLRRRVIVTLKSRDAFGGVLVEADDRAWVLRDASAIGAGEHRSNLVVDGEVVLLVGEIAYVQMP
jgi:small nuclear ribonucleoprotein (snRNP)-like protein